MQKYVGDLRIQTPPLLQIATFQDGMELYNPSSNQRWTYDNKHISSLIEILTFCKEWKTQAALCDYIKKILPSIKKPHLIVQELCSVDLLETDKKYSSINEYQNWSSNGWGEAATYHIHTNLLPKMNYALDRKGLKDKEIMKSYLEEEPPPPNYKSYEKTQEINLLEYSTLNQKEFDFYSTICADVTKGTENTKMSFEDFSWLTYLAYGQTHKKWLPLTNYHVGKTSPSGGSRHPTEVYLIAANIKGVSPGLYHYNIQKNSIELLKPGNFDEFSRKHIFTHPTLPNFPPALIFLYTCIFERSMYRYRESRSYRVIHYDLGHLLQTTAYLASSIKRKSYRAYSFHDELIDNFLEIDGLQESSMAFMAIS